jgi:hypothetical protein
VAMLRSSHGVDFGKSTWGQKLPFRIAAQCDSALSRAVVLFAVRAGLRKLALGEVPQNDASESHTHDA